MIRVSLIASEAACIGLALALSSCADRDPLSPQESRRTTLEARRDGGSGRDFAPGHIIVLKEHVSTDATALIQRAGGKVSRFYREIGVVSATGLSAAAVTELAQQPEVDGLTPNIRWHWERTPKLQLVPTQAISQRITPTSDQSGAELFNQFQWNLRVIRANDAWLTTNQGAGARVALLDSGIDANHIDLVDAVDPSCSASFVPTESALTDFLWHGTLNAGIIRTNGIRGASVAPDATLCSVKVGNVEGLTIEAILGGILYTATIHADVANMSFGGYADRNNPDDAAIITAFQRALDFASQHGVLLVASLGNDAINTNTDPKNLIFVPAELNHVISVGATAPVGQENFDQIASYSNVGRNGVDVFAPGGDFVEGSVEEDLIIGPCSSTSLFFPECANGRLYLVASGTSQAAPHVAGAAAVIESEFAGDQNDEFLAQCILKSADPVTGRRNDPLYSRGRLNVLRAAECAPATAGGTVSAH